MSDLVSSSVLSLPTLFWCPPDVPLFEDDAGALAALLLVREQLGADLRSGAGYDATGRVAEVESLVQHENDCLDHDVDLDEAMRVENRLPLGQRDPRIYEVLLLEPGVVEVENDSADLEDDAE